jgi:hypothetical protein
MNPINSDRELRQALDGLSAIEQRHLGGLFVENALSLCEDTRIRRALQVAMDPRSTKDECEDAFRSAKAYAVHSYTECGRDTDWSKQAAHFIATAAACLLADEETAGTGNRAWRVAMQVRNARNCALMAPEGSVSEDEADCQYRIANAFLAER